MAQERAHDMVLCSFRQDQRTGADWGLGGELGGKQTPSAEATLATSRALKGRDSVAGLHRAAGRQRECFRLGSRGLECRRYIKCRRYISHEGRQQPSVDLSANGLD